MGLVRHWSISKRWLVLAISALALCAVVAQRRSGRGWWGHDVENDSYRTPRDIPQHSYETPTWTNISGFDKDVFTFARIKRERSGRRGGSWWTDTPDSDLNLSFRLHQTTSVAVDPNGLFLRLTDKALLNCPFIYMVEPGSLYLSDQEAAALRKYLLNGGFLMLDDFWGEEEWAGMAEQLKKVFPEREFSELPLDHALYRCVFEIKAKDQVPNVNLGTQSQYNGGITWERWDAKEVHHRVIFDDHGRIMVIATHNTDNGDGWEWEGDNSYYFEHFSEKTAYPLAINIIFYAMTH